MRYHSAVKAPAGGCSEKTTAQACVFIYNRVILLRYKYKN